MSLFFNREIRIPAKWLVALGCVLALLLAGPQAAGYVSYLTFRSQLSSALSPTPSGHAREVSWSFPFQATRAMVRVEVDEAELAAAQRLNTDMIFGSTGALSRSYIKTVVAEQASSPLVDRLAAEFRRIRDERGLDADEYLELLTVAVQAIPYGDTEADTMLGADMLAKGNGICTDKSLLLGSLLVHEGYDTVMWLFDTQRHVALGVASTEAEFRNTGYTFIETTAIRFVGQAAPEYRSLGPIARPPMQIALGGTRRYHAGAQVEAILAQLRASEEIAAQSNRYLAYARRASRDKERYAQRAIESWQADGLVLFVMANAHDREGVYQVLFGSAPPVPQIPTR
jgi:hypothetical protein